MNFPTRYLDDVRAAHGSRAHIVLTFTLGHETGHHIQLLLHRRLEAPGVDLETQADCYAGFWARREAQTGRLDVDEFRTGAEAELRRLSRDPDEASSHGDADKRIASLDKGLAATDPAACDVGALTWQ
jgi:predicted metalloprotease